MFTSLGLPRWNDRLALYEMEVTLNGVTSSVYGKDLPAIRREINQIASENLQQGREQLTRRSQWASDIQASDGVAM
jgi:hypothetical protein